MLKDIIDIADRNKAFAEANEKLAVLREGFIALSLDYSFHIENAWGGNHKIFQLKDNIEYRFFSSLFHCRLLLQQHYAIERRLTDLLEKEPDRHSKLILPKKHPDFTYAEQEVSAIFDSIVFHLSSIFDYISLLINFICVADRDQTPQWKVLCKSARDNHNVFSKRGIAGLMDKMDGSFVIRLYDYRSELIHRKSDISEYAFESVPGLDKRHSQFVCSTKIRKTFKMYGDGDHDYTVSHFSMWLIDKTIDTIATILSGLKREVEKDSKFPFNHYKDGSKPIMVYVDPVTNTGKSPSVPHWETFEKTFSEL